MAKKTVLVIVAHADDMEFFCGGTVAKLVNKGHDVYQVITTNNEKGSHTLQKEELISQSREAEAKVASKFLGLKDVFFLEYPDGEVENFPRWEIMEKYMRHIRKLKPNVVITWDYFAPYEPHPDHRTVGRLAMEAAEFAHLPLYFPEHAKEGLEPHFVNEYFFMAKNPVGVNKAVDVTDTIDKKIAALLLHKSQMELTVGDVLVGLKAAGINPEEAGISGKIDENVFKGMMEFGIKSMAEETGKPYGMKYAEVFRYKGFGLAAQVFPHLFEGKDTL